MQAWSYSSLGTFKQCPKKYYHLKVAKDVKDVQGVEASYGEDVHKAAELYVKDGTPIPEKYAFMRPIVEPLARRRGDKYAEVKLGVARNEDGFYSCEFFSKDVWYRGIADLLIVDGPKAWLVDYKTGKSAKYADTKQLDLLAGATFVRFPEVQTIKSALLFVVSEEFINKTHTRENMVEYLTTFDSDLTRLAVAMEHDKWSANPSGLCGWCPVESCPHWRPRR